jgi:hypothetical protein
MINSLHLHLMNAEVYSLDLIRELVASIEKVNGT